MHRIGLGVALLLLLLACSPDELPYTLADLPEGNAARGATLFEQSINGTPACATCHTTGGGRSSGPALDGYAAVAGERVQGQTAREYTFYSIVRPAKHIVRGYSNVMHNDYASKLSQQEVADLIAFLLTLS